MKARSIFGVLILASLPNVAAAQATSSSIAGIVKDATGAVLPGVTVEAASPALIEKVRTVVSDGEGNYKVVDLRPGTYTVTFSLAGFSTVKREGIALATGFTAQVNADLKVGDVSETITVTGAASVVDVQNARIQNVLSKELLDATPAGIKDYFALSAMTVGMRSQGIQDVGGNQGSNGGAPAYHGINGSDAHYFLDGMPYNSWNGNGGGSMMNWRPNKTATSEMNLGLGATGAEYETSGVQLNLVPREGGNQFSLTGNATYMNNGFQGTNLTDAIRARNLNAVGESKRMWDYGVTLGGPIVQDKVWFIVAPQWWGVENTNAGGFYNATQGSPFYTPDPSRPALTKHWFNDYAVRMTWQVNDKDKIAGSINHQEGCGCLFSASPTLAPEFLALYRYKPRVFLLNWTRPQNNRFLLQGGLFYGLFRLNTVPGEGVERTHISTIDAGTGHLYNAPATPNFSSTTSGNFQTGGETNPLSLRFTASYVTGSHALKFGVDVIEGWHNWGAEINQNRQYIFFNRNPISITQIAGPFHEQVRLHKQALFVQDQWTLHRLTLNLGARYDAFNGEILPETIPAGDFVGARDVPAVKNVPNFKDITPRVGVAYDVFGNGRTALKASWGRYLGSLGSGFAESNNPAIRAANSTSRSWVDSNRNFIPDCNLRSLDANGECGAVSNRLFGQYVPGTTYDADVLAGWGNRNYSWQVSTSLQQELWPGWSATVGYYRNWYENFYLNVNQAVTAADFTEFCYTVPTDARIPGGGGNRVCGNYDVSPARFGQVNNRIALAKTLGIDLSRVYNGVDVSLNGRFDNGAYMQGGLSIGRTVLDDCALNTVPNAFAIGNGYVADSFDTTVGGFKHPGTTEYCHITPPWEHSYQLKLLGVYPLPLGFQISGVFQNLPGIHVITSNSPNYCATTSCRTYTNAEIAPSLGRNLAAGPAGTVILPIVAPQALFEERLTQLDVRFIKGVRVGRASIKGTLDIYNVFNSSSVQRVNGTFGAGYRNALVIMAARLAKIGAQVEF